MPTRTINLKLRVSPRSDAGRKIRTALWTTHSEVNRAVAKIERLLLLCRGESYYTVGPDGEELLVEESRVREEALEMARAAQKRNGADESPGSDDEVLKALRKLYEAVVPSAVLDDQGRPGSGDAQTIGNSYAGPVCDAGTCRLTDPERVYESGPFRETASKKFAVLPDWVIEIDKEEFDRDRKDEFVKVGERCYRIDLERADAWFELPETRKIIDDNRAFNKDGWLKSRKKGESGWAAGFVKKQLELRRDVRVAIREELWQRLRLLPLGELYFREPVGNLWNRLVFRLAVAHLLSWESWNHQTRAVYDDLVTRVRDLENKYQDCEAAFEKLREYETARHEELRRVAFVDDDNPFTIGPRMIRGWERIREEWLNQGWTEEERLKIQKALQGKLQGRFGDPDLFGWLAKEGREWLWQDRDLLTPFVNLNQARRILGRHRPYSLMTFAEARLHPRWAMYEAPGGSNLRNYRLIEEGRVEMDLLISASGKLKEEKFILDLAPSGQLRNLRIVSGNRAGREKTRLDYESSHQAFSGYPGGAEILFDRSFLENHAPKDLETGKCGPVWFKLTIDVLSQAPPEWLDGRGRVASPPTVNHFRTALANKSKHRDKLEPGLRVLSVDLGQRNFATCSVFELVDCRPEKGLFFATDQENLWARHERSFKLMLPGEEKVSQRVLAFRRQALDELFALRRDLLRLKEILRLKIRQQPEERCELLLKIKAELVDGRNESPAVGAVFFDRLLEKVETGDQEEWERLCLEVHREAERIFGRRFGSWRRQTRRKPENWQEWRESRSYRGGKSAWMIEYLENVRRLLLSWSTHGRDYGEVNRQDRKRYGTVASKLLRHINNLKEDRVKAGTDLIIQAARGYVPNAGNRGRGWHERYQPCRLILFEDLARYRFRVDRPRRENSRLMQWSHREILSEATLQAEIYGIIVETTGAGFTSRFHAASGAPGVRCRRLTEDDFVCLDDGRRQPKEFISRQLEGLIRAELLEPGMLVPWEGGELFATVSRGRPVVVHADINAAQNLQRRFWTRCADAYRAPALFRDGKWEVQGSGARLLGALELLVTGTAERKPSRGFVLAGDPGNGAVLQHDTRKLDRVDKDGGGENDLAVQEIAGLLEEIEAFERKQETFFRDPAGEFFSPEYWYGTKFFWGRVRRQVNRCLNPAAES